MTELNGYHVMIVEDAFYLAMELRRALEGAGASVLGPFADEDSARAGLARGNPDCAVLDVNLGDGASFVLAQELRARKVPILFLTGYDRSVIPREFEGVALLKKPLESTHLLRAVAERCGGARVLS